MFLTAVFCHCCFYHCLEVYSRFLCLSNSRADMQSSKQCILRAQFAMLLTGGEVRPSLTTPFHDSRGTTCVILTLRQGPHARFRRAHRHILRPANAFATLTSLRNTLTKLVVVWNCTANWWVPNDMTSRLVCFRTKLAPECLLVGNSPRRCSRLHVPDLDAGKKQASKTAAYKFFLRHNYHASSPSLITTSTSTGMAVRWHGSMPGRD